jgi:rubredoxin-NAD+ reductase
MNSTVVIGSGLAGYNVARELRKLDRGMPLTVITADGGEFYSKPTLSNALAANKTPAQIPIRTAAEMARELDAVVRTRTRVTAIEPDEHRVRLGEESLPYARLVLAIGAEQIRLPLAGDAAQDVMTVNSLEDYARFRQALEGARSVAIVGAGLIGCEFANDLAAHGVRVEVTDVAAHPLPRLLPAAAGTLLARKLAPLGVRWHFGTSVRSVRRAGAGVRVELENGETIAADLVLSAVGLVPQTALARAAGLATARGIVVNRWLETSAADVYALGDCAEVEGQVLPFVMPIMHAARALAATLAGRRTAVEYPAMPVVVKTPACPAVVSPPAPGACGAWRVEESAEGVKALYLDGDSRLLGFALVGSAATERAKLASRLPPVLA